VPVRYVARFDPPIGLDDIRARSQLADLMVLRAPQGTNFKVTQAQASALIELIQGKGFMAPQLGFQAETVAPLVR
jgi:hypothetical protein